VVNWCSGLCAYWIGGSSFRAEDDVCGGGGEDWLGASASGEGLSKDERLRDIPRYRIA
jgi:hypothetical protein